ncbi:hypothetical protein M758_3G110500 [Ceratodon purpureus]|nr:hypothetical protein M758_3G110500 [Ceratodon purpureus]
MAATSPLTAFSFSPTRVAARSAVTLGAPWTRLAALHPRPATSNSTVPCNNRRSLSGRGVRAIMGNGRQERVKPGPGQESVWDYPRPPALEPVPERIRIEFNSKTIADTTRGYRVLETSHPPVYYIPQEDLKMEYVKKAQGSSFCEWKGNATYWTVQVDGRTAEKVGWSYESPTAPFRPIKSYFAFYCAPMDACYVGDERAQPQPGGFYGGWVTSKVVGPFKGGPGSWGW